MKMMMTVETLVFPLPLSVAMTDADPVGETSGAMIGVGALPPGDGAGGKVAGIGTAVGGEAALESSPRPVVNCHGVPRIDCTASALYCSPTGRRLIVRINFTPVAVPMMFSSVASERPSHTPLLQGLRALFARDAGELSPKHHVLTKLHQWTRVLNPMYPKIR